jgi:hypothetical protein
VVGTLIDQPQEQESRIHVVQNKFRVEMVVVPSIDVVGRGVLIRSIAELGSKSTGVLIGRNLNQSLALIVTITKIVSIPQMVLINLITTIHVNMTIN